ncbi:hypothetical protein Goari_019063 [Gossypium aridum]|uniref:Uncharacterized protein n=1 Tax=Gossypium aridum TaxID=34290 RepID=A0A7J8WRM4_GOSAI|nr:hypothetical protein [Gossypium aridum]
MVQLFFIPQCSNTVSILLISWRAVTMVIYRALVRFSEFPFCQVMSLLPELTGCSIIYTITRLLLLLSTL